jgi:hypothetical protein
VLVRDHVRQHVHDVSTVRPTLPLFDLVVHDGIIP